MYYLHDPFVNALLAIINPSRGKPRFGAQNELLRESQVEALAEMAVHIAAGERIGHAVMPGGTGKTRVAQAMAAAMHSTGHKTLYVIPTQNALINFVEKTRKLCPHMEVGSVYQDEKTIGDITFITNASLMRRFEGEAALAEEHMETPQHENMALKIHPLDYRLVVWDEGHNALSQRMQALTRHFTHAIQIATTATPRFYSGKELGISLREGEPPAFGNLWYELSVDKAQRRKEMPVYENILVNTSLATNLGRVRPDEEESGKVARAIDLETRHAIVADMYKHHSVKLPNGKILRLAGEPAIAFDASIRNVHHKAEVLNYILENALKRSLKFRGTLEEKGIDPADPKLVMAAAIHSGGRGEYDPMSLAQREDLIAEFKERKVLMLVSTSLLQQSFDHPEVSVVFDCVPRQTFVGVGQAAMRALRTAKGKHGAVLVNMEDKDHRSLTFEDFRRNRGAEEGTRMDSMLIGERVKRYDDAEPLAIERKIEVPKYKIIAGGGLNELVEERLKPKPAKVAVVAKKTYEEDESGCFKLDSSRMTLTRKGSGIVDHLLQRIVGGDNGAQSELVRFLEGWKEIMLDRYARQYEDGERERGIREDSYYHLLSMLLARVVEGSLPPDWSQLSPRISGMDRDRKYKKHEVLDGDTLSLHDINVKDLVPVHVAGYEADKVDDEWEAIDQRLDAEAAWEKAQQLLKEARKIRPLELLRQYYIEENTLEDVAEKALNTKTGEKGIMREGVRQVMSSAYGFCANHLAMEEFNPNISPDKLDEIAYRKSRVIKAAKQAPYLHEMEKKRCHIAIERLEGQVRVQQQRLSAHLDKGWGDNYYICNLHIGRLYGGAYTEGFNNVMHGSLIDVDNIPNAVKALQFIFSYLHGRLAREEKNTEVMEAYNITSDLINSLTSLQRRREYYSDFTNEHQQRGMSR